MPVWIWENMQADPAYECVGIVRSENLMPLQTAPGPIPLDEKVRNFSSFEERERLVQGRGKAAAEREEAATESEKAAAAREQAATEKENTVAAREQAATEREEAATERENAAAAREQSAADRERLAAERERLAEGKERAGGDRDLFETIGPIQMPPKTTPRNHQAAVEAKFSFNLPSWLAHERLSRYMPDASVKTLVDRRTRGLDNGQSRRRLVMKL
jgi:hypothetical protein